MMNHIELLIEAGVKRSQAERMLQKIARFDLAIWNVEGIAASVAGDFLNEEASNWQQVSKIKEGVKGLISIYSRPDKIRDDYKTIVACFPRRSQTTQKQRRKTNAI